MLYRAVAAAIEEVEEVAAGLRPEPGAAHVPPVRVPVGSRHADLAVHVPGCAETGLFAPGKECSTRDRLFRESGRWEVRVRVRVRGAEGEWE